jgi:hypothetical protein
MFTHVHLCYTLGDTFILLEHVEKNLKEFHFFNEDDSDFFSQNGGPPRSSSNTRSCVFLTVIFSCNNPFRISEPVSSVPKPSHLCFICGVAAYDCEASIAPARWPLITKYCEKNRKKSAKCFPVYLPEWKKDRNTYRGVKAILLFSIFLFSLQLCRCDMYKYLYKVISAFFMNSRIRI